MLWTILVMSNTINICAKIFSNLAFTFEHDFANVLTLDISGNKALPVTTMFRNGSCLKVTKKHLCQIIFKSDLYFWTIRFSSVHYIHIQVDHDGPKSLNYKIRKAPFWTCFDAAMKPCLSTNQYDFSRGSPNEQLYQLILESDRWQYYVHVHVS